MNYRLEWSASTLFEKLARGTEGQRRKAREYLMDEGHLDIIALRRLLHEQLQSEFSAKEGPPDKEFDSARSWLLNSLARISRDDPRMLEFVEQHVAPEKERSAEVRFWAFEGLAVAEAPNLEKLAERILLEPRTDDNRMLMHLATVLLAARGRPEVLAQVLRALSLQQDRTHEVAPTVPAVSGASAPSEPASRPGPAEGFHLNKGQTLRALSVVSLPGVTRSLCDILEEEKERRHHYSVISALRRAPAGGAEAEVATRALTHFVQDARQSAANDGSRAQALNALGNLGSQEAVHTLLVELTDGSPSIVAEAARALEKLLNPRAATLRIVEQASQGDQWDLQAYVLALRFMRNRLQIAEELEAIMLSGRVEQQNVAKSFLRELGGAEAIDKLRAQSRAASEFLRVMESAEKKVEEMFTKSIDEARQGFRQATWMSQAIFACGLVLVFGSGALILLREGNLQSWVGISVAGGPGLLAILYSLLLANPRKDIEQATHRLMQLKIVFLTYLRQLHQTDQAFSRRLLESRELDSKELQEFNELARNAMQGAIHGLGEPPGRSPAAPAGPTEPGAAAPASPGVVHAAPPAPKEGGAMPVRNAS